MLCQKDAEQFGLWGRYSALISTKQQQLQNITAKKYRHLPIVNTMVSVGLNSLLSTVLDSSLLCSVITQMQHRVLASTIRVVFTACIARASSLHIFKVCSIHTISQKLKILYYLCTCDRGCVATQGHMIASKWEDLVNWRLREAPLLTLEGDDIRKGQR